jgi:hypothetical protein
MADIAGCDVGVGAGDEVRVAAGAGVGAGVGGEDAIVEAGKMANGRPSRTAHIAARSILI